jgi:PTH1 family peptidyl-tRNA hydrolase
VFEDKRFGFLAQTSVRGRKLFLLKPTTYMNLSGNAVRYWLEKENIPNSNLLVIVDDKDLPQGKFRLRGKGSGGSHNGLGYEPARLLGSAS